MRHTTYELFGVECGKGWKHLVDPLIAKCQEEGAVILQIKEKFGGLRFYYAGGGTELQAMVDLAEAKSYLTCAHCGTEEGVTTGGQGWIFTLCGPCRQARDEKRRQKAEAWEARKRGTQLYLSEEVPDPSEGGGS